MLRIKAIFRARAIPTPGVSVYRPSQRKKWLGRLEAGARARAAALLAQLDVLLELRPKAKAAMIEAARRQPGWKVLRSIPFLGPVRVAVILAIMRTPFRFRTKRNLWPYAGLAVITRSCTGEHAERQLGVHGHDRPRVEPQSLDGSAVPRWAESHKAQQRRLLTMEFRTFVAALIHIPAQIVRTARKIRYRLLAWNEWQSTLFRLASAL